MELKQLQYFLAVAEHLNFSRAAESLYISQPTLSYQIAELERELGAPLFIRDRRKVYLSPLGGVLVAPARETLASAARITAIAQQGDPGDEEDPRLALAFDSTEDHFEFTGMTNVVAEFQEERPEVRMEMRQQSYNLCVEELMDGELDAAILVLRHNETLPSLLAYKPVYRDDLVLVTRTDPDVTDYKSALKKYDLIMVSGKPRGQSRLLRALGDLGVTPNILTVDSIITSFAYLQAGKGCINLPAHYVKVHRYQHLQALPIPGEATRLVHVIAWNKASSNPNIQRLVNSFPPLENLDK